MYNDIWPSPQANTSFNQDAAKAGTGRRFLGSYLKNHTNCYTLEVSFFSYGTPGKAGGQIHYTEESCIPTLHYPCTSAKQCPAPWHLISLKCHIAPLN